MALLNPSDLSIRKTSVQLNIAENLVELVINHKWKSVHEAQYNHTSIEDSGLGTFKVRPRRAKSIQDRLASYLRRVEVQLQDGTELTDKQREKKLLIIENLTKDIEYLQKKIDEA